MSDPIGTGAVDHYKQHKNIHPRKITGRFDRLRDLAMVVLLSVFYVGPWINWGDRQAVLWDLPARKFYIYGLTIWPQDLIYLAAILIIMAVALFFFTTLAGRLWCGYACPQTVWTEAMLWIDEWFEGDHKKRRKLDESTWNGHKIRKRGSKYVIYVLFSAFTGVTFVGYFTPIRELMPTLFNFTASSSEYAWVLIYGGATLALAGFMREQVCTYMCPYARFQGVMFDPNTLIISYDKARGEPRASTRAASANGTINGDCIDCSICVQVCPAGIDIRDGLQYQCIGCALCIDACDEVMEKIDRPKGLIRYTTENELNSVEAPSTRPRVWLYAVLLVGMLAAVSYSLATRSMVELDIIKDRNSLYRDSGDGRIENVFRLRVANKDTLSHDFKVRVEGLDAIAYELVQEQELGTVKAGEIGDHIVRIVIAPEDLRSRTTAFNFVVESKNATAITATSQTNFMGPQR